jgi:type II secretory pathway component PulM
MKKWFLTRPQNEQISLAVLAGSLVVYGLWMGLLSPLQSARDEALAQNVRAAEVKQQVNAMVTEIQRLRGAGATQVKANLLTLVNQVSQSQGLPISRMQPSSNGELQVRFESVLFNDVVGFLHQLETVEGVIVREVALTQTTVGVVSATIRLAQGG